MSANRESIRRLASSPRNPIPANPRVRAASPLGERDARHRSLATVVAINAASGTKALIPAELTTK
jgi:hypothetical protein